MCSAPTDKSPPISSHLYGGCASVQDAHDLACLALAVEAVIQVQKMAKYIHANAPARQDKAGRQAGRQGHAVRQVRGRVGQAGRQAGSCRKADRDAESSKPNG